MMALKRPVVMIVDGYKDLLTAMEDLNSQVPRLRFVTASTTEEAKEKFEANRELITSVFVDSFMPDFVRWVKGKRDEGPAFLLVAVYSHNRDHDEMVEIGCDRVVCKPFSVEEFWGLVGASEHLFMNRFG